MSFFKYINERFLLFKNRSFLFFTLNCLLAPLGNGLVYIALSWNSQNTGSSLGNMALLTLCLWGPSVVMAPIIGWFVDRFSPKFFTAASNLIRGLLILVLALNFPEQQDSVKALIFFSVAIGFFNAFYAPAALVLVRRIVEEKQLLYANSTTDCVIELFSIVGVGSAGIFLTLWGSQVTILIAGLMFIAAGLCLIPIRLIHIDQSNQSQPLSESLRTGLGYLFNNPSLQLIYIIQAILMMVIMTTPVLLAPYAKDFLSLDIEGFSKLEALFSVGAILGGIIVPYAATHFSEMRTLSLLWILLAASFFILASVFDNHLTKFIYSYIGFALSSWAIVLTKAQEMTPLNFQGRLLSLSQGLAGGLILMLYLLAFVFDGVISVITAYYIEAFLISFCWIVFIAFTKRSNKQELNQRVHL